MMKTLIVSVIAVLACFAHAKENLSLSTIVPLCRRDDPKIDDCIARAVEQLKPTLKTGIPELEVPGIDPLFLEEIIINPNSGSLRAIGKSITVRGASDFKITRIKSDLEHHTFYVGIELPSVEFQGKYEVNFPTPFMRIKGAGPINGTASNIRMNAVFEAKVVKRADKSFYQPKTLDIDIKIGDYKVDFLGMFPEKSLDKMASNFMNERSTELSWTAEPLAERAAASVLLSYADRIMRHLPVEDLFPQ